MEINYTEKIDIGSLSFGDTFYDEHQYSYCIKVNPQENNIVGLDDGCVGIDLSSGNMTIYPRQYQVKPIGLSLTSSSSKTTYSQQLQIENEMLKNKISALALLCQQLQELSKETRDEIKRFITDYR